MAKTLVTESLTVIRLFEGDWQLQRLWRDLETGGTGIALGEYGDARGLLCALAKEMGVSVDITL